MRRNYEKRCNLSGFGNYFDVISVLKMLVSYIKNNYSVTVACCWFMGQYNITLPKYLNPYEDISYPLQNNLNPSTKNHIAPEIIPAIKI